MIEDDLPSYHIVMFQFATWKMIHPLHWISIHQSAVKTSTQRPWLSHEPADHVDLSSDARQACCGHWRLGDHLHTGMKNSLNAHINTGYPETWTWKPTSVYCAHNHLINPKIHKLSAQYSVTIQVHHQKCFGSFTCVNPYPNHFQSQTDLIWCLCTWGGT
jgi:hypothetical protein